MYALSTLLSSVKREATRHAHLYQVVTIDTDDTSDAIVACECGAAAVIVVSDEGITLSSSGLTDMDCPRAHGRWGHQWHAQDYPEGHDDA